MKEWDEVRMVQAKALIYLSEAFEFMMTHDAVQVDDDVSAGAAAAIAVSNIVTQPPQPGAIRKLLNDVVSGSQPAEGLVANVITAGDYDLNISVISLEKMTRHLLEFKFLCIRHQLSQEQHRIQHNSDYSYPKWFIPNTLKYYVLLHDVSAGDEQRAESIYEEMKQKYGTQGCYLLKINSRTSNRASDEQIPDPWSQYLQKNSIQNQVVKQNIKRIVPLDGLPNNFRAHPLQLDQSSDPSNSVDGPDHVRSVSSLHETKKGNTGIIHGACLTLTDHDRIRQFIQEFTFRGLLPHIEKTIRQLNDQLISRKGLSRSLFSATKKWFSGSKVPEKSINELKNTSGLLYPPEAPELQIRKMADLCFLVQHYDLAYNCYHTAKKDFLNDQAMLYAAGALFLTSGAAMKVIMEESTAYSELRAVQDWWCTSLETESVCTKVISLLASVLPMFLRDKRIPKQWSLESVQELESKKREMAAVSAFLQPGAPRPYPAHYMDTAIQTYRDICKNMVLAERCVLLSAELLKSQSKYSEAAALLIRLTSEDSDLRSALLLEQAAHCFINMKSPMVRKYAFHMILAGHRFSKAGQLGRDGQVVITCPAVDAQNNRKYALTLANSTLKRRLWWHLMLAKNPIMSCQGNVYCAAALAHGFKKHALRCYCQAMQVYKGKGWSLAEDHINFTIGRQSYTLRQLDNAVSAFRHILINESKQSAVQQGAFLREYLYVYKNVSQLSPDGPLPQLPLPYINSSATRVFFGHDRRPADGEKQAATHVSLDQEYDSESSQQWRELEEQVVSVVNKGVIPSSFHPTQYCLNSYSDNSRFPLAVVEAHHYLFYVTDEFCKRVWSEQKKKFALIVTSEPEMIGTEVISEFLINGEESKVDLEIQGPRLNNTKEEKTSVKYGPDRRLDPIITEEMPLLENTGKNVAIMKSHSHLDSKTYFHWNFMNAYKTVVTDATSVCTALISSASSVDFGIGTGSQPEVIPVPLPDTVLLPGASVQLPMWLRGPDEEGVHEINFLFYYESVKKQPKIRHRILRHTAIICTSRSLNVRATVCRSNSLENEEGRGGNMLVFVDVENTNTSEAGVKEFHVVQVSSSSKHWKLQKSVNLSENKDAKLASREKGKFCFKAIRCEEKEAATQSSEKYTFADIIFGNEQVCNSASPCADFFYRSLSSEFKKPQAHLPVHTEKQSTEDAVRLIQKCGEVDLNIVILWKAYVVEDSKQLILEGQHHVILHTIGKEAFSYPQKQVIT
ncbi:Trafficking protein particle complex 8 [Saguinus oedipus]|uniref:Trafficking protein particle complex 8 n=1 Tax=Saguinus oedipus TaxID=9490 RepID=A0ABQ9UCH2_SAGOE|nr:Trafficking protein particle complex 8 [Saguinus oedipus]